MTYQMAGLPLRLAECCVMNQNNPVGCAISIKMDQKGDFALFNESQSRIMISLNKDKTNNHARDICPQNGIELQKLAKPAGTIQN